MTQTDPLKSWTLSFDPETLADAPTRICRASEVEARLVALEAEHQQLKDAVHRYALDRGRLAEANQQLEAEHAALQEKLQVRLDHVYRRLGTLPLSCDLSFYWQGQRDALMDALADPAPHQEDR